MPTINTGELAEWSQDIHEDAMNIRTHINSPTFMRVEYMPAGTDSGRPPIIKVVLETEVGKDNREGIRIPFHQGTPEYTLCWEGVLSPSSPEERIPPFALLDLLYDLNQEVREFVDRVGVK